MTELENELILYWKLRDTYFLAETRARNQVQSLLNKLNPELQRLFEGVDCERETRNISCQFEDLDYSCYVTGPHIYINCFVPENNEGCFIVRLNFDEQSGPFRLRDSREKELRYVIHLKKFVSTDNVQEYNVVSLAEFIATLLLHPENYKQYVELGWLLSDEEITWHYQSLSRPQLLVKALYDQQASC